MARGREPDADAADAEIRAEVLRLEATRRSDAPMRSFMIGDGLGGRRVRPPWPARAWSLWPCVMTARSTARAGSIKKSPGLQ